MNLFKNKRNNKQKDVSKIHSLISLIISVVALFLSGLAIYFQFFYEKHKIYIAIIDSTINITKTELNTVILNVGNKSEYINSMEIKYYSDRNFYDQIKAPEYKVGPIYIKPGEKVPFKLCETTGAGNLERINNENYSEIIYVGIIIEYIGSNALLIKTQKLIGQYSIKSDAGIVLINRIEIKI